MSPTRISNIRILFSKYQPLSLQLFGVICSLLNQDPNSRIQTDRITFNSNALINAQPSITIELEQVGFPKIVLNTDERIYTHIGHLFIKSSVLELQSETEPLASRNRRDNCLNPDELFRSFRGHIVRLDHTGVDIPPMLLPQNSWQNLMAKLGPLTNLYRYPMGQEWNFIIPASQAEYESEITRFTGLRSPKFELAYDSFNTLPAIQFTVQTDLTQDEIESRLPAPLGFNLPGADTCRSVYLAHPWPNINIRFDFFYAQNDPNVDWDTGKWLVMQGGRIK